MVLSEGRGVLGLALFFVLLFYRLVFRIPTILRNGVPLRYVDLLR